VYIGWDVLLRAPEAVQKRIIHITAEYPNSVFQPYPFTLPTFQEVENLTEYNTNKHFFIYSRVTLLSLMTAALREYFERIQHGK
jgi:hypothetical protein